MSTPPAAGHEAEPSGPVTAMAPLTIKLPAFEGPLDLLLHLVRKNEIDIKDIPIVLITEQYLAYLNFMKELNLDIAGDYLVMAATLVHIKSKMLLPPDPVAEGEAPEDPRAELVRQLLEYEKFQHAAEELRERHQIAQASHGRGAPPEFEPEEELLVEASLFDLVAAFKNLLDTAGQPKILSIESYRLSVADRVQELIARLDTTPSIGFRELFEPEASRHHWIVTFLALLELARLCVVRVMQRGRFGEITIVRRDHAPKNETGDGHERA